jgi:hypothetical protein
MQMVLEAARYWEKDGASETNWNGQVHLRVTDTALRGWRKGRHVTYYDV